MSTATITDLKTPPTWAEHFGVTGLIEEEWQTHTRMSGYSENAAFAREVEWNRPMTEAEFKRLLHGDWMPVYPEATQNYQRKIKPRTKAMPKFVPTAEAVLDALNSKNGWVSTTGITKTLAEPMGWTAYDLPPNTKVMTQLKALAEQGIVIEQDDAKDKARIPTAEHGEGSAKMWMSMATLYALREDRRLDEMEHDRRRAKADGWLASLDEKLVAEVSYVHGLKLAFVEGVFDVDRDTGKISMDWATMERIIDLSPDSAKGRP